ncbi:uncharacterized protein I206_100655 [Kwoniella pini CBS 10737]|uniref:CENP-C homolog n=1 Tax=Kwoniella pini CBS 10737 TaxID=1296096 RepID=A0A1B9ICJ8_9TREE|nr:uncharacterized protein I206_00670 [Kwoniella pini CBS 10737]OCF53368.1 hypothetical protein I206_00670 [Kwoniella pini CBS 10737]
MASRTPGRTRRGEEKHVPYNDDPKMVGTRSNAPMPTNVARLHDGFEDPAEFFQSPGTDVGSRTISSVFARTPKTPGARSDYTVQTPMTGDTIGTMRKSKGRRSEFGNASDDEAEEELDGLLGRDDLLDDEDDLNPATPKYHNSSNPPSVTLPSRSRISVSSPGLNRSFDAIPSPRASNSAARSSPRKSALSRIIPSKATRGGRTSDLTDGDIGADDTQELDAGFDADLGSSPLKNTTSRLSARLSNSPTNAKKQSPSQKKRTGTTRRETIPDSYPEESVAGDVSFGDDLQEETSARRKSTKIGTNSKASNLTREDEDDASQQSASDNDGPSYDNDGGMEGFDDTAQDISLGNNYAENEDNGGDVTALVDDMAGDNGLEDVEEEDEEDLDLEQDAIDTENRSGEETERPKKSTKRPPVAKTKKSAPRQAREDSARSRTIRTREGSVVAKPKRTRISQVGIVDEEDEEEDGYHGTFKTRRSTRTHYAPLDWWRNERVEYARGPGLPVIKAIVTMEKEEPQPLSKVGRARSVAKARQRSVSESKRKRYQDDDDDEEGYQPEPADEDGWDANTDSTGLVKDYPSGAEATRIIACPKSMLKPKDQKTKDESQTFRYQKIFGEGNFMAAGVVHIGVGKSKAPKPSKDNAYVFYVIQGAVQVQIYRTSFVMAPGGQFLVPRGNDYSIENISPDKEAQLFFAQARKIRADEEETEDQHSILINGNRSLSIPASSSKNKSVNQLKKKKKLSTRVRDESGTGSGDGDDY